MAHQRKIIYLIGLLFALPLALMAYINSSFLSTFMPERFVGVIYALGSLISVIALLLSPKFFAKAGGYKFLITTAILNSLSIILFAYAKNSLCAALIFISGFTLNSLTIFALDEFIKILSKNSATGSIRGLYIAISNLGWIFAQFSLGVGLGELSFRNIYLVSFTIMLIFVFASFFGLRGILDPKYDQLNTRLAIKEFFQNKNLLRAYGLGFLLQFFYSWMVIYSPIYLSEHIGFSWQEIGFIFAIMLLPFSMIPAPLGRFADKIGERKILMWAYLVASIATICLFFIQSNAVWIWAFVLFITRVGAASIEIGADSYFFKHIKPENEEFIGVYRTAMPIAYIVGPLTASFVLTYSPAFNFIFLVLGAIMLYGIYLSSTIRKRDI